MFILLAVFRDEIVLWIMNYEEVATNPLYSQGQHRGNNGNEGQLHINESNIYLFDKYKLENDNIEQAVKDAVKRSK